jgi:DNA-binding NtrC family response regulator
VDDDEAQRCLISEMLSGGGFQVCLAEDGQEALDRVESFAPDVILTDLVMPRMDGFELLARLRDVTRSTPAIVLTGFGSTERAVSVVHDLKAFWYLEKPVQLNALLRLMERAVAQRRLLLETERLNRELSMHGVLGDLVGQTEAMQTVFSLVRQVAPSTAAVLITGESGTGKELVAREIHRLSPRAAKPFVAVNCAALPETLIESELFGHERGAFTGAFERRAGCFEQSNGGTLFLDEIAEMPIQTQAKLLRVLDNMTFRRLGSQTELTCDARIVAATNRQLEPAVGKATMREDLYYRLNVFRIHLPPLRDRKDDIPPIAESMIRTLNLKHSTRVTDVSAKALQALHQYDWPGNVRELRNVLERAVIFAGEGAITPHHIMLPSATPTAPADSGGNTIELPTGMHLREAMQAYIEFTLKQTGNNRRRAAAVLGISLQTLHNRLAALTEEKSDTAEAG